ncbi:hypothetical protein J5N97_001239 [Dioscorea zingiberensis]|uniref:Pentatricopeptide repeat-containing protein n=1 Tax=Dioscorea zingiberensis TaxID=325984 RepID=A0A9D5H2L6_9LILI|nr:hypothetical protein J5N97_001239 [Dioscorea zingiberensis]
MSLIAEPSGPQPRSLPPRRLPQHYPLIRRPSLRRHHQPMVTRPSYLHRLMKFSITASVAHRPQIYSSGGCPRWEMVPSPKKVPNVYSKLIKCHQSPNLYARNVLIHAFCKMGLLDMALKVVREGEVDVVSYNTVIWGFCDYGMVESGLGFLSEMFKRGVGMDTISCNTLLKGLCDKGLLDEAESLMKMFVQCGIGRDVIGCNTLLNGYCKLGPMSEAMALVERMKGVNISPDIISYNTLLDEKTTQFKESPSSSITSIL